MVHPQPKASKSAQVEEQTHFLAAWTGNGFNAAKAYQELHPNVTYASACVLGSRQLRKVKDSGLLDRYGLNIGLYLKLLIKGLDTTKVIGRDSNGKVVRVPDNEIREKYHRRLGKLLGIE